MPPMPSHARPRRRRAVRRAHAFQRDARSFCRRASACARHADSLITPYAPIFAPMKMMLFHSRLIFAAAMLAPISPSHDAPYASATRQLAAAARFRFHAPSWPSRLIVRRLTPASPAPPTPCCRQPDCRRRHADHAEADSRRAATMPPQDADTPRTPARLDFACRRLPARQPAHHVRC